MKKYFIGFMFGLAVGTWGWSGVFEIVDAVTGKAKTEISGGVTFEKLSEISKSGADFVSIGALTHSAAAVDISMNITTK